MLRLKINWISYSQLSSLPQSNHTVNCKVYYFYSQIFVYYINDYYYDAHTHHVGYPETNASFTALLNLGTGPAKRPDRSIVM